MSGLCQAMAMRLGDVDADQQRAGQPRPFGDGDRVDLVAGDAGCLQRLAQTGGMRR